MIAFLASLIFLIHFNFLTYVAFFRSAPPYKLSRWDKQLLENLFVLLISWLAYVLRDNYCVLAGTSMYIISFIPVSNLWCNCMNFGIMDFLMALAFQAAARLTLGYPYAPVALAVGGVSLLLVKNELLSNSLCRNGGELTVKEEYV